MSGFYYPLDQQCHIYTCYQSCPSINTTPPWLLSCHSKMLEMMLNQIPNLAAQSLALQSAPQDFQ